MIKLSVAYNENSEDFESNLKSAISNYEDVDLITYHENTLKGKKKAFKLKGGFSAKESPFAVIHDTDNIPVKAFYTEAGTCTVDEILKSINSILCK